MTTAFPSRLQFAVPVSTGRILVATANGKPQTANSRLPFTVNAMLKVSIKTRSQEGTD